MVTRLVILLTALTTLPLWAAAPTKPPPTWVFGTRQDKDLTPHTAVFLHVGGKRVLILRQMEEFHALARSEYREHGVPADALTACAGWWAGAGDDLYVIRRGRSLVVYRRELDEQEAIPPYKRLKVIFLH